MLAVRGLATVLVGHFCAGHFFFAFGFLLANVFGIARMGMASLFVGFVFFADACFVGLEFAFAHALGMGCRPGDQAGAQNGRSEEFDFLHDRFPGEMKRTY
jgi:hypothetical protein